MAPRDTPSTRAAASSTSHQPVSTHTAMATAATAMAAVMTHGVPRAAHEGGHRRAAGEVAGGVEGEDDAEVAEGAAVAAPHRRPGHAEGAVGQAEA